MGYASDLGSSKVFDICHVTGYPHDKWGHLLNPLSLHDGMPMKDWDKEGTDLHNLTNPYGHLYYACGTGDDFYCFDYATIQCVTGQYIILDSTLNCETGCFITGGHYEVMPARSMAECREAVAQAESIISDAEEWCFNNGIIHSVQGWNQKPEYFLNCVAQAMFSWKFKNQWSERMYRKNTKKIREAVNEIMKE